jgi:threonine dehydrogenase-like Zn-dependent dehydrogenase
MRALTTRPGCADTTAITEIPEPRRDDGDVLVRTLAVGICGTDREIIAGRYGTPPPGAERLILGHEALGEVLEAPPRCGLAAGDHVVPIVRLPDDPPCASCAAGEWDMCLDGRYTEHGIRARDGFATERFRIAPRHLVRVDRALGITAVLVEPASVLAKAWEQIERIGRRAAAWRPRTVLVTGAGPIGLLAALLATQRGLDVHVFDRVTDGVKPALVRGLGGTYHVGAIDDLDVVPDIVIECVGAPAVVGAVLGRTGPLGITCLTGISSGGRSLAIDLGAVNRAIVLENDTVFGSVNANRRHYEAAARALAAADVAWLDGLITRRLPLERWREVLTGGGDHVKTIVEPGGRRD